MKGTTVVWVVLVVALALLTLPSVLTLPNTLTWALSWIVGAVGVYGLNRFQKRRRQ
jgi:hypothetical protein